MEDIARGYNGRRLFVLYNPATERRIGTTHSFFATISSSPPDNHHVPHRHSSSAINYYLRGNGYSKVSGERLDWKAGDLILSAPGWAMHSHHSGTETTSALTVQDHPLQIAHGIADLAGAHAGAHPGAGQPERLREQPRAAGRRVLSAAAPTPT